MKLLHSADWHLGAPLGQAGSVREALASLPELVVDLALQENCDLMLLSGDIFDAAPSADSLLAVQRALARAKMPVFIAPGNHDPATVWPREGWPENVHIFRSAAVESISLPDLSCRVYGAAFLGPESPGLLKNFRAEGCERWAIGVFHGDPTLADSPYSPITRHQVQESGLDYLALGHIHKGDSFRMGETLCAWPGCAMARGFDETGEKGVLLCELDGVAQSRFVPLPLPRFHSLTAAVEGDAFAALQAALPALGSGDFYRVTLTGESEAIDLARLAAQFPQFPNLELRDQTLPPLDLWEGTDRDSLEGVFFSLLQQADAPEAIRSQAARICRQLLSGQEVVL